MIATLPLFKSVIVRRFRPDDRSAIRDICQKTALRGKPTNTFFEDEEIVSILFADYYMDYEPESCFVAEIDGRVVGYALACKDTKRYEKALFLRIVPRLIARVVWKIATLRYRRKETYQTLWWVLTRSWREIPTASLSRYPAHMHINVEPEIAEMKLGVLKLGMKLGEAVINHLREAGIRGMQGAIAEEEGDDHLSRLYCTIYGGKIVAVRRFTLWEMFTAKRWYAKLILFEL